MIDDLYQKMHILKLFNVCVSFLFPFEDMDEQGLLFLSASQDQNVHLWKFQKPSRSANDSGDDVIGDGDNVADSAILLHQFKGHARSVDALAVSPNKQEVHIHTSTYNMYV